MEGLKYFRFKALLQKAGWLKPAYVGVDEAGLIRYLSNVPPGDAATESVTGIALPGFQNAHSHAFQYAMAGGAEIHSKGASDDFWSWREAMYRCALAVGPDEAEAIAAMLYAELLRNGYTHVAEFHYLHHNHDGTPYAHLPEMGERMIAAAKQAGIRITLIPAFYQKGGFGREPEVRQRRFISKTSDEYLRLLDASRAVIRGYDAASLGFSAHSLRAVTGEDISRTVAAVSDLPFHMHVAEQKREVSDCLAAYHKRPVQWMLDNLPVSDRFFLVHATHLDDGELQAMPQSGATVVLCPSTEGNLGDGIFRMKEYAAAGGHWCVGTDSHIGINPLEEFRMLDYRQRLLTNKRNTFDGDAAQYMIGEALTRGRLSMGRRSLDFFELGQPLDAVVYDSSSPRLEGVDELNLTPSLLYHDSAIVLGTLVSGGWVARNNHHLKEEEIRRKYLLAMKVIAKS